MGIKKEGIPAGLALLGDNKHFFYPRVSLFTSKKKKNKKGNFDQKGNLTMEAESNWSLQLGRPG